ncbi:MAG: aromatic amino acid lyase, partial [Longimicrobiaceae bacterium]
MEIDGDGLTLEEIVRVAEGLDAEVALAAGVEARVLASRRVVEDAIAHGAVVYGVTTGFGRLAETVIPLDRIEELQLNLIRSHACGTGPALSRAETRAVTLLRA